MDWKIKFTGYRVIKISSLGYMEISSIKYVGEQPKGTFLANVIVG